MKVFGTVCEVRLGYLTPQVFILIESLELKSRASLTAQGNIIVVLWGSNRFDGTTYIPILDGIVQVGDGRVSHVICAKHLRRLFLLVWLVDVGNWGRVKK